MKKLLAVLLALVISFVAVGCQKSKLLLYSDIDIDKYVEIPNYKEIKVKLGSDKYNESYEKTFQDDVTSNNLFVKKTEGKVQDGDVANIDYVGTKDGVAFDGGTASGYSLTIGSGTFIPGFEDGLIGKDIGSTVDLNLKFPENYGKEDLNGKAVVFTVTINYVESADGQIPENVFEQLGFSSVNKYKDDLKNRAIKNFLADELIEKSKTLNYPEESGNLLFENYKSLIETNLQSQYNMNLNTYLSQIGKTEAEFKEEIMTESINPMMDEQMPFYSVLKKEKIEVTQKDIDAKAEEIAKKSGDNVTVETVKEYYGEVNMESLVVRDKVLDFLKKQSNIK